MKITILSKIAFNRLLLDNQISNNNISDFTDVCFISINNSSVEDESYLTQLPIHTNDTNVLNLVFDDINLLDFPDIIKSNPELIPFSYIQAYQIIEFIRKNKNVNNCVVHCSAGVSRSGAVGKFINDYFEQDYDIFIRNNPFIYPNPYVTNLLKSAINKIKE